MDFVRIRPVSLLMGCSTGDSECYAEEKPAHRVVITRAFEIGKYQVTQAQYQAVTGANPSYFQGPELPVEGVSWEDARRSVPCAPQGISLFSEIRNPSAFCGVADPYFSPKCFPSAHRSYMDPSAFGVRDFRKS